MILGTSYLDSTHRRRSRVESNTAWEWWWLAEGYSVQMHGGGTPVLGSKCCDSHEWRSGQMGRKNPSSAVSPVLGSKCCDSHEWRSGQMGRKNPSSGLGREEVGTHVQTGMEIVPWWSWSACCVPIRPPTDAETRTMDFLRPCNKAPSPSSGSPPWAGEWNLTLPKLSGKSLIRDAGSGHRLYEGG